MAKQGELSWEERVENVLRATKITEVDFKEKGSSSLHERILDALKEEWNKCRTPVLQETAFQIDFVGRISPGYGKMELTVEVDTWFKPIRNWIKLLDINASNKIWVYLCREKDKATAHLEDGIKEFRKLARLREENKDNNITIYMKVADEKELVKRHLFE